MLFYGQSRVVVPVAAYRIAVSQKEAYLRTGMDEELQTSVLTECQMCKEDVYKRQITLLSSRLCLS